MSILIADDDGPSRFLLRAALAKLGHQVVEAIDGMAALECFQREYFPVVISDWLMPQLDGLQVCRAVRSSQYPKYTYVILLTALDGRARYLEAMDAGADDFLTKPLDVDELRVRLRVADRLLNLQEEVKQLSGLLSACMYCKRIRDEANVWVPIESYISKRSEASFSHGVCPECLQTKLRPELERAKQLRRSSGGKE